MRYSMGSFGSWSKGLDATGLDATYFIVSKVFTYFTVSRVVLTTFLKKGT